MSGIIVVTERPSGYCLIWRRPGAPDYAYRRGVATHDEAMRRARIVAELMGATVMDYSTLVPAAGESPQGALSQRGGDEGEGRLW